MPLVDSVSCVGGHGVDLGLIRGRSGAHPESISADLGATWCHSVVNLGSSGARLGMYFVSI